MRMFHQEIRTARRKTLIQTAIHPYRIRRHGTLYLVLLGLAAGKFIDTLLLMENAMLSSSSTIKIRLLIFYGYLLIFS